MNKPPPYSTQQAIRLWGDLWARVEASDANLLQARRRIRTLEKQLRALNLELKRRPAPTKPDDRIDQVRALRIVP